MLFHKFAHIFSAWNKIHVPRRRLFWEYEKDLYTILIRGSIRNGKHINIYILNFSIILVINQFSFIFYISIAASQMKERVSIIHTPTLFDNASLNESQGTVHHKIIKGKRPKGNITNLSTNSHNYDAINFTVDRKSWYQLRIVHLV